MIGTLNILFKPGIDLICALHLRPRLYLATVVSRHRRLLHDLAGKVNALLPGGNIISMLVIIKLDAGCRCGIPGSDANLTPAFRFIGSHMHLEAVSRD